MLVHTESIVVVLVNLPQAKNGPLCEYTDSATPQDELVGRCGLWFAVCQHEGQR